MIVNRQALNGIFTAFNTIFNSAFAESNPLYDRIATVVPSTTDTEDYSWLGTIPQMREWIGDREIQNLSASNYSIRNKNFELTVGVPRNAIEDDKIGLYRPSVQSLAQSAAEHPDMLVFNLLAKGFTEKCYDGEAFFSKSHKVGNKKTVSNKGQDVLNSDSYVTARSAIMSMTDDKGKPLNLVPDLLVVPPALESMARILLVADQIEGTTNIFKGTAEPLVVPQLAGNDKAWYLLCTKRPVKPLIFQDRKKPTFVSLTNETDENVFMRNEFIYGVDSRCNTGFAFWQMAYGSDGTAVSH